MVRPVGGGAEPELPVEPGRHVVGLGGAVEPLRPDRAVGPVVHLAHGADEAGLHPLADQARALHRVALVAHLRGLRRAPPGLRHQGTHLVQRARQRLLAVDVLAGLERSHGDGRVGVVGGGDGDGVDALRVLVEHLAEVAVPLRPRVAQEGVVAGLPVHVAERVDRLAADTGHVRAAHPPHPDAGDAQRVARRAVAPPQHVPRDDVERPEGPRGLPPEFPPAHPLAGHRLTPLVQGSPRRHGGVAEGREGFTAPLRAPPRLLRVLRGELT